MRVFRFELTAAMGVLFAACCSPSNGTSGVVDAGVADAGPYEGATVGGAIPEASGTSAGSSDLDAGGFVTDETCCQVTFAIADEEPAEATGVVLGTYGPLAAPGVPLSRGNGMWTAAGCMPLHASFVYWYQFTVPAPDGGEGGPPFVIVERTNPNEPNLSNDAEETVNTYGPVASCSDADGGAGAQLFLVTPSGDSKETIEPAGAQIVRGGATQAFTVVADNGYALSAAVGGTCAAGSFSGSVYTTGPVTASCAVVFSASPLGP